QHRDQRLHHERADGGASLRQREGGHRHGGAHDGRRMRGAEAARVAAHQVPLELRRRRGRHRAVAERPAAGVEPVDDAPRAREREELAMARREPLVCARAERHRPACGAAPDVPHPMTNESRYLCCNLHYEKTEISDANYLKGTLIPFGTRVQVLEVRKTSVKFQPAGQPPITLVLKYGKDAIGMDQYLELIFLREDPHAKLPKPGKDKKQAAAADRTR